MGTVTFRLDAESAKAVEAFLAVENRASALEQKLARGREKAESIKSGGVKKMGEDLAGAGQSAGGAALGVEKVIGYVSGMASLAAAVNGVKSALQWMREEAERGAASLNSSGDSLKRLPQISNTDAEYQRLVSEGNMLREQYGLDEKQAYQAVFDLYSTGQASDLGLAA